MATARAARRREGGGAWDMVFPFSEGSLDAAGGRSPGFRARAPRLPGGRWPPVADRGLRRLRHPVTVAGPRRLLTGLPWPTGRMNAASLPPSAEDRDP